MSNLQTALDLARNGYYVHPLKPRDKKPLTEHGYNAATRDEEQIRAWWEDEPDANVGICLHKTGLVDIAPDSPEWAERFKLHGMPATTLYSSGGGAGHWHAFYRLPSGGAVARDCVPGQYDVMSEGNAVAPGSIHPSGRPYELRTKLLPVEDLPLAPAWAVEMLQERVKTARVAQDTADWQNLPSGATLAHSRRFQALCKANDQLRTVCAGGIVILTTKSGAHDGSPSIQRSVFVNQLLRAKYPHNEIRALALHFEGVLVSKPKWFETDIDNLLRCVDQGGYTPKDYRPESTGVIAQLAPRGGRHYEITAAELFDRYNEYADCGPNGIVLEWTVDDAAARLGVSSGTIKRREAELTAVGQIQREYGRVILSPVTWAIRSQPIAEPQKPFQIIEKAIEEPLETSIGSQFDIPQQDAPNPPKTPVCIEHARIEITHSPGQTQGPDRDLLGQVRDMARRIAEPGWYLRDYDEMPDAALQAELARLRAVADDQTALEGPQAAYREEWAQPLEGEYTGQAKRLVGFSTRWDWSSEAIRVRPDADSSAEQRPLDLGLPAGSGGGVCSFGARRAPNNQEGMPFYASAATNDRRSLYAAPPG